MPDREAEADLPPLEELARQVVTAASVHGRWLATAESLTAGAVVARLVDVPGASACVAGGAACYREAAKARVLGVDPAELEATGAVTASVARAMATGARSLYQADLAVSTTGVAGPGADARGIPAGRVHLALASGEGIVAERRLQLEGDRSCVRARTVRTALDMLLDALV